MGRNLSSDWSDPDCAVQVHGPTRVGGNFPSKSKRVGEIAMESPEVSVLGWLEDGPTGGLGRFDDRDDLFLALDHLGQRERSGTGPGGHGLTDVSFERVGSEEAEE